MMEQPETQSQDRPSGLRAWVQMFWESIEKQGEKIDRFADEQRAKLDGFIAGYACRFADFARTLSEFGNRIGRLEQKVEDCQKAEEKRCSGAVKDSAEIWQRIEAVEKVANRKWLEFTVAILIALGLILAILIEGLKALKASSILH